MEELLEMHLRVFSKGNVGFAVFIQGTDFTAFDVIYPAVQTKSIISQSNRDTRMRFNVVELRDNVLFHHGVNFIDWVSPGFFLDHGFRGIGSQ